MPLITIAVGTGVKVGLAVGLSEGVGSILTVGDDGAAGLQAATNNTSANTHESTNIFFI